MIRFLLILCLFCSSLIAQTIEIKAPAGKVKHGKLLFLSVTGLDDTTRSKVKLTVQPQDDSHTAGLFGDTIVFEGEPKHDTKYTITLGANEFRKSGETFFVELKAAGVDKSVLDKQVAILAELEKTHPYRFGSCVVEVAGEIPFVPPTDPPVTPPVDPSKKVDRVTYVFEKDQGNVPRPVEFALQRINRESAGSVVASWFEDDQVDGMGQVPDQYKVALAESQKPGVGVPCLVVQSGPTVLRVVKAPKTELDVTLAAQNLVIKP